jgi:hypothetical protein
MEIDPICKTRFFTPRAQTKGVSVGKSRLLGSGTPKGFNTPIKGMHSSPVLIVKVCGLGPTSFTYSVCSSGFGLKH